MALPYTSGHVRSQTITGVASFWSVGLGYGFCLSLQIPFPISYPASSWTICSSAMLDLGGLPFASCPNVSASHSLCVTLSHPKYTKTTHGTRNDHLKETIAIIDTKKAAMKVMLMTATFSPLWVSEAVVMDTLFAPACSPDNSAGI